MRKMLGIIGGLAGLALMGGTAFASSGPLGALTSQPDGTLTIQYVSSGSHAGDYEATWNWSGIQPNQSVMLIGDSGTTVSLTVSPETVVFGQASASGGTATVYIPPSDYFASPASPETFKMYALFSSTPTGQLPEVPYAAGLPVAAALAFGGVALYRRRHAR